MDAPQPPLAAQQSAFVAVVGWVFVALASMGTLIGIGQNLMIWSIMRPDLAEANQTMPLAAQLWFGGFLALSANYLVAAVGLLLRKTWAHTMFSALLVLGAVYFYLAPVVAVLLTLGVWSEERTPASLETFVVVFQVAMTVVSLGLGTLFCWLFRRLRSPEVRAEFGGPRHA